MVTRVRVGARWQNPPPRPPRADRCGGPIRRPMRSIALTFDLWDTLVADDSDEPRRRPPAAPLQGRRPAGRLRPPRPTRGPRPAPAGPGAGLAGRHRRLPARLEGGAPHPGGAVAARARLRPPGPAAPRRLRRDHRLPGRHGGRPPPRPGAGRPRHARRAARSLPPGHRLRRHPHAGQPAAGAHGEPRPRPLLRRLRLLRRGGRLQARGGGLHPGHRGAGRGAHRLHPHRRPRGDRRGWRPRQRRPRRPLHGRRRPGERPDPCAAVCTLRRPDLVDRRAAPGARDDLSPRRRMGAAAGRPLLRRLPRAPRAPAHPGSGGGVPPGPRRRRRRGGRRALGSPAEASRFTAKREGGLTGCSPTGPWSTPRRSGAAP